MEVTSKFGNAILRLICSPEWKSSAGEFEHLTPDNVGSSRVGSAFELSQVILFKKVCYRDN